MLEKRISPTGHIYAKLSDLRQWERNPRDIYAENELKLRILIANLGLFKPLFVTQNGVMVGGNMRLPALQFLNENVLEWDDEKGHHAVDIRGKYTEVPITELGFIEVENGQFKSSLDGIVQEKVFNSIEQIMIEYSTADNQSAGQYNQDKAHELFLPHMDELDMSSMTMNLSPAVSMDTFMDQYKPSGEPPKLEDNKKSKSKEINLVIKFTPEQYSIIEPKLEKLKTRFGTENMTDLFNCIITEVDEGNEPTTETERESLIDAISDDEVLP